MIRTEHCVSRYSISIASWYVAQRLCQCCYLACVCLNHYLYEQEEGVLSQQHRLYSPWPTNATPIQCVQCIMLRFASILLGLSSPNFLNLHNTLLAAVPPAVPLCKRPAVALCKRPAVALRKRPAVALCKRPAVALCKRPAVALYMVHEEPEHSPNTYIGYQIFPLSSVNTQYAQAHIYVPPIMLLHNPSVMLHHSVVCCQATCTEFPAGMCTKSGQTGAKYG